MAAYKRILLKLSGEAMAGAASFGIDADRVKALGREVADVAAAGVQVGVVVVSPAKDVDLVSEQFGCVAPPGKWQQRIVLSPAVGQSLVLLHAVR